MEQSKSILDEITAEVSQLTDEEIAQAAAKIQERQAAARARMTPETKQKMKDREKRRRLTNQAILKLAKEKGLVAQAQTPASGSETVQ